MTHLSWPRRTTCCLAVATLQMRAVASVLVVTSVPPVRAELDPADRAPVPDQSLPWLARLAVPDPRRAVPAGGRHKVAAVAELRPRDPVVVI